MTTTAQHDIATNFQAAYSWFQRTDPELVTAMAGGMLCCHAPGGLTDFNVALPDPDTAFPEPSSAAFQANLRQVQEFFQSRGKAFSCWLPLGALVAPAARTLGFSARMDYMSQHLNLKRDFAPAIAPDNGLIVRRVTTAGDLSAFADLIASGWPVDAEPYRRFFSSQAGSLLAPDCPKQLYIGWIEQAPACCMELFVQPDREVVGIYYVATHAAFRRQGHAMHIQSQVLTQAQRNGYRAAVVVSEPGERRIMARMGFADLGLWYEYIQDA